MSRSRHPEMRVVLDSGRTELVRAFVREASLSEGVSPSVSGLIAEETARAWPVLCTVGSADCYVRLQVRCLRNEISSHIRLPGRCEFSAFAQRLKGQLRTDTGISGRERGISEWEVYVHRCLSDLPDKIGAEEPPPIAVQSSSSGYIIEIPQKADAPAIARCFLAVYGHRYVHPEVFSPRRYWGKVENGELLPVIARDGQGEVAGHVALERGPGTQVAERGEAVVLPAHRGHGLLERMTDRLSQEAIKHDLQGIYAEPVTVHTYSQRNDERAGMPVCAVLLGVNPETFHPRDTPCIAGQRQSYLRTFRFIRPPASRAIYAPEPYRKILNSIYASLGVTLSDIAGARSAPKRSRTRVKVNARGYGVIAFEQIGSNAAIELGQALCDVYALGARSVQFRAPLDDHGLPNLTEAARDLGFFFCGLAPGFADGRDLLLLQFLSDPLETCKLQIFTDAAKDLVAFVDNDRCSVSRRMTDRAGL
jgi:hypothetical protein